jgi:hypothetical protein
LAHYLKNDGIFVTGGARSELSHRRAAEKRLLSFGLPLEGNMKTNVLLLGFLLPLTAKAGTVTLSNAIYSVGFTDANQAPESHLGNTPITKLWESTVGSVAGISVASRAEAFVELTGAVPVMGTSVFLTDAQVSYVVYIDPNGFAPLNIDQVPVIMTASGTADCTPLNTQGGNNSDSFASAFVEIGNPNAPLFTKRAFCGTDGISHNFTQEPTRLFFGVRQSIPVAMLAEGDASMNVLQGAVSFSFSATADPTFQIDPSFEFASDFQILVSPDGTQTSIPEPATYATLACGLAGILLARNRISSHSRARIKEN